MQQVRISAPFDPIKILELRAGMSVLLSGTVYTARDAAHKRLLEFIDKGIPLPFDIKNACIYHCGPCPAAPGEIIGPCGPTTSQRIDAYTPALLELGLKAVIGKGGHRRKAAEAFARNGAVYLAATGGAAMLIARKVTACEIVAFPELGAEAVYRLTVSDMPLIVAIDAHGGNLFETGPKKHSG